MVVPKPGEKLKLTLELTCTECEWLERAVTRIDRYLVGNDASATLHKFAYATPREQLKFFKAVAFFQKFIKEEIIKV